MFTAVRSAATVACAVLALSGSLSAFAGGRGAGTPPSHFYGLHHTPLGAASLGTDPAGRLVVSNIGSSGQDGVSIDLGKTTGFAMQPDIGPSGALPAGMSMTCTARFGDGTITDRTAQLQVSATPGGQCALAFRYTGDSAICCHTRLLLEGAVVASRVLVVPVNDPPLLMASGNIGTVAGEPPLTFTCSTAVDKVEWAVVRRSTSTPTSPWLVALPGLPAVQCDEVSMSLEGLPPAPRLLTYCDLQGTGVAGGAVTISDEALRIKHKGWDGLIYHQNARATGQAQMTGIAGPDICAGCYECCHPETGSALAVNTGVLVSNIGSSGNDGVSFTRPPWFRPPFFPEMAIAMGPVDMSDPDAAVRFTATGTFSDMSTRDITARVASGGSTGGLSLSADFSSLASSLVELQVFSGGGPVGSVVVPNQPGSPLASLFSLGGGALHVTRCITMSGDASSHVGMALHVDDSALLIIGGQVFIGDECRMLVADSTLHVLSVDEITCSGAHIPHAKLTCRREMSPRGISPPAYPVVHDGVLHTALGQCALSSRDSDGDGVADLLISNIGSSGQDGVAIDLGEARGCSMVFAGSGAAVGSQFSHMDFDVIDDQCATCPGGVVAGMDIDGISPNSAVISASVKPCCRGHVTLIKRTPGGFTDTTHTFPYPSNDPWSVGGAPGSQLRIGRGKVKDIRDTGSNLTDGAGTFMDVLTMHLALSQTTGGGGSGGVTMSHPLHGTFTGIDEIVISQCIDEPPYTDSIQHARMLFTASPVCNPCSVTLGSSDVVKFQSAHHALGQAEVIAEDCDDSDPALLPVLWAANIGSSGNDGVSIDLERQMVDRDCAGAALPDVVGVSAKVRGSFGQWLRQRYTLEGSMAGDAGPTMPLAGVTLQRTDPVTCQCTCDAGWMPAGTIRVTVRDQFGNSALSLNGLPPGTRWCGISGSDDPGTYQGAFTVTVSSTFGGGPSMLVHDCTQTLDWPSDMTFLFPGHPPVVGRSLEMFTTPPGGTPVAADFRLNALKVTRQAPASSVLALGITDEQVIRMPPVQPCPADINGDHSVNVADLLSVISAWGACQSCPATPCPSDINHDCSVNVADLLTVISSWGACP